MKSHENHSNHKTTLFLLSLVVVVEVLRVAHATTCAAQTHDKIQMVHYKPFSTVAAHVPRKDGVTGSIPVVAFFDHCNQLVVMGHHRKNHAQSPLH